MARPYDPGMGQKYPSMASVNTMNTVISMGYLPPGHGYVPKKQKPEKPYGLPFTTVMNRTHRGPGKKYLYYALACAIVGLLFFMGAALYVGHRNVSRMIVKRTEVFGALMVVVGIVCVSMVSHYIWKARVESNRWRAGIKFRPQGLSTAAAINLAYVPEMAEHDKLATGTYGPKALKEIPKPRPKKKKKKGRSRAGSQSSLAVQPRGGPPGAAAQYPSQAQPYYDLPPKEAGPYPQDAPYPQPSYPAPQGPGDFRPIPMQEFGDPNVHPAAQRAALPLQHAGTLSSESEL